MVDWLQTLIDILAVFSGVFLAFSLDRLWDWIKARKESVRVLSLIRDELLQNAHLLTELKLRWLRNKWFVPYYHLNTAVWSAVSSKIDVIRNEKLLAKISQTYFNFDMFERTLGYYIDMANAGNKEGNKKVLRKIEKQMAVHRSNLQKQMQRPNLEEGMIPFTLQVVKEIIEEIKRLDC